MAVGDILSVTVGADGWWADIVVAGLSTGGTYAFGLGANNNPATGTPKIVFTVVSMGFDDTGTATTLTRTVYGTKQVRQPYPNAALNQETAGGGNVTVRVALSDYIYAKDATGAGNSGTAPTVTILSGFYTQAATPNNAATALTVTNSSTAAYPKVVGNWSWPSLDKITGSTFTLRAVAFHSSARSGRPVRAVKFTAADTSANTATITVTSPTVDSTVGDQVPVTEYVATMSAAALTALNVVTCNFIAYPWIGDAGSILDTSAGTVQPTPLYGPITLLNDKSATYGTSYAVVDPVSGNDATGAVSATFNSAAPPAAYLTIFAAYNAVRTYNNTNYARNNCGGSTIYLRTGSHAWMGGTPTLGTTPATWLTITRFPTDAQSGVIIATQSGGKSAGLMLKLVDVAITAQSGTGTISAGAGSYLWLDQCTINCPTVNQPPFYVNTVWHVTRCTITALNQSLAPYGGTTNAACSIVRGNTITALTQKSMIYTMLGNRRVSSTGGGELVDIFASQTVPAMTNMVIAYNQITMPGASNAFMAFAVATKTYTHGAAIIQNVLENISTAGQPVLQFAADSSTGTPVNNILFWHNTFAGQRNNMGYNEVDPVAGGGLAVRWGWSIRNNIFDEPNIKSDTLAGSGFVADASKVGNWPLLYGAGCSGNLHAEDAASTAGGAFLWEFAGVSCDQPAITGGTQPPAGTARAITYPQFVDRRSYNGSIAGAGGGDYRVASSSPAMGLPIDWVLPYDIAGAPRSAADPAGAYISISTTNPVLISSGFFALG